MRSAMRASSTRESAISSLLRSRRAGSMSRSCEGTYFITVSIRGLTECEPDRAFLREAYARGWASARYRLSAFYGKGRSPPILFLRLLQAPFGSGRGGQRFMSHFASPSARAGGCGAPRKQRNDGLRGSTCLEMAEADKLAAAKGVPSLTLMDNAGRAVADEVEAHYLASSILVLHRTGQQWRRRLRCRAPSEEQAATTLVVGHLGLCRSNSRATPRTWRAGWHGEVAPLNPAA